MADGLVRSKLDYTNGYNEKLPRGSFLMLTDSWRRGSLRCLFETDLHSEGATTLGGL